MQNFKEWLQGQSNAWKATKTETIDHWRNLPNNIPFTPLRAIPYDYKGRTYGFDGIRVTGSGNFINGVLSRIKDLLVYEGDNTRLELVFKQQESKNGQPKPDTYMFYFQCKSKKS